MNMEPTAREEEILHLTDKQIFTQIWTSPRKVFKFIHEKQYDKYANALLVIAGIAKAFDRASNKNMGDDMSLWSIVGISIIGGGLLGWISYYFYAALVSWTGSWLKGEGDTRSILRVIAYAMFPVVFALILLIPQLSIYGIEIFKTDGDLTSVGLLANVVVYSSMIGQLVLGIWAIALTIIGVSEVQKLSIAKTILNLFLPILFFVIPILLLVMIVQGV